LAARDEAFSMAPCTFPARLPIVRTYVQLSVLYALLSIPHSRPFITEAHAGPWAGTLFLVVFLESKVEKMMVS
jgi:hypothetical protein